MYIAELSAGAASPTILASLALGFAVAIVLAIAPIADRIERQAAARVRSDGSKGMQRLAPPRFLAPAMAVVCLALGVALVGGAVWLFTEPTARLKTVVHLRFQHAISLGYVAYGHAPGGAASAVTADTVAQTGGQPPLYTPLLSRIDLGFSYRMTSTKPLSVTGYGGTALRIEAEDGWERTIALLPAHPLAGADVVMWSTLDLEVVRTVISGVEFVTGSHSAWYDLTVIPVVRLSGELGKEHIDETYAPEFRWRYDASRITPDAALRRSEPHDEQTSVEVVRHLHAFGLSLPISLVRWLALIGGMAALVCGVCATAWTRRGNKEQPDGATRMQLVVSFMTPSQTDHTVPVASDEPPG